MARDTILPGNFSWLGRQIYGITVMPQVRNQNVLTGASCSHHALSSTIETMHEIENARNGSVHNHDYKVDLPWLILNFPPPTTTKKLIISLQSHKSHGTIKASKCDDYPFKATDSIEYSMKRSSPSYMTDLQTVIAHLKTKGPVVGSFYPDSDYNPSKNLIYVSKDQPKYLNCPECDYPFKLRHAVCVVGIAEAMVNNIKTPCFQYIETDNPEKNSMNKDGICYMTFKSMHSITIPKID